MQNDWAKWLSEVKFIVNNALLLITLTSFFLINLNQNLRLNFKSFESLLKNLMFQAWNKLINVEEFIKKMKKLTEHLHDEMLIAQIIYEFNVNLFRRSCSRYFIEDEVWLNACNLSITHLAVKLDDYNINLFKIKRVFKNNSLIIELNLSCHSSKSYRKWFSFESTSEILRTRYYQEWWKILICKQHTKLQAW